MTFSAVLLAGILGSTVCERRTSEIHVHIGRVDPPLLRLTGGHPADVGPEVGPEDAHPGAAAGPGHDGHAESRCCCRWTDSS